MVVSKTQPFGMNYDTDLFIRSAELWLGLSVNEINGSQLSQAGSTNTEPNLIIT